MSDSEKLDAILKRLQAIEDRLTFLEHRQPVYIPYQVPSAPAPQWVPLYPHQPYEGGIKITCQGTK